MPVKTAIRVISLESAAERRAAFTRETKDAGVAWEFFTACTEIKPPLTYDERKAVRRFGRPLSNGEVACYTNHYKVWEWLANSDYDQAFIFEDDVYVDWPAIGELAQYNFSDIGLDLFRLMVPHAFKSKPAIHRFLSLHSHMLRGVGLMLGGAGYLLTRKGAKKLVENYSDIRSPSDWILARYWEHRLPAYTLFPFPMLEKYMPSSLGNSRADIPYQMSALDRVVRFYWRVRDRVMREWVERFELNKDKFGETADIGEPYLRRIAKGSAKT